MSWSCRRNLAGVQHTPWSHFASFSFLASWAPFTTWCVSREKRANGGRAGMLDRRQRLHTPPTHDGHAAEGLTFPAHMRKDIMP